MSRNRLGSLGSLSEICPVRLVCSTWRAVSHSELLWQNLTRRIWNIRHLLHNTWHEEYIYRHRTANNFQLGRYEYTSLPFVPSYRNNNNDGLLCRRLALSNNHLAAGFSDGSVHLFHLPSRIQLATFYPEHRDRFGRFACAISGIILSDAQLVFATLDGDIHLVIINGVNPLRRVHLGDVVNDGALVDFSGCNQWWVGLYAGVPDRAFHVWNSETEELIFVGGSLTDPEAVMGWHMLNELTNFIGRVRVTSHESAVACTNVRVMVFDLRNVGIILGEEDIHRGINIGSFDANRDESMLIMDMRGVARVRRVTTLEEGCRFTVRATQRGILGSINGGYALMCVGGVIRVWEMVHGEYLYSFRERIGECNAIVSNERHVAACSASATIHIWDFGAN
ncbi:transcriptional regulator STERILE APETALA-like isoform X2 [Olea europaea var. sylvestris]|uniref:transcriptional regulator STERILE APETALA-like isoform X2 n=1 Tax=Olea europaea var. sylvestris TaxID=158386 RepID=UPI000C1CDA17|nr:transcriptional regulator STERILE APETALA-like isoform X2 [Olea europaea var. sylvestris]